MDSDVIIWWFAVAFGLSLIVGGVAFYASVAIASIVAGCSIVFLAIIYMLVNG